MTRKIISIGICGLGLLFLLFATSMFEASAQKMDKQSRGSKLYMQYCASCHGVDGKGGGPAAPSLKGTMPDLTMIPKENGKFPGLRVLHIISGDKEVISHGSKEMPVWGQVFRERKGDQMAKLDIYALQEYIESIQQK